MKKPASPIEYQSILQIVSYQLGLTPEDAGEFIPPSITVEYSKKTKRIRYIYLKDDLWGILRPTDGIFLLTPSSASFLIKHLTFPKLRVVVQSNISEFILKGGNVFAKHVVDCDPLINPRSEVIVVNEDDLPLAIGRAEMVRAEMLAFQDGIAVKVRKGI